MSRTVEIVLGVLGLGVLAYWWMSRQQQAVTTTGNTQADPCSGGGVLDTVGGFIRDHVQRKNALAPFVASAYAKMPPTQAAPLTNIAGKLDISAKVESFIGDKVGNALCNASFPPISSVVSAGEQVIAKQTSAGVQFGTSQLKAGTVAPVKDVYSAGQAIARGDVTGAVKAIGSSVVDGPKAAYEGTKNLVKSVFSF